MWIQLDFRQEDIDKAGDYSETTNCLGCVVLKRVLGVNRINMGGFYFNIEGFYGKDILLSKKLENYLSEYSQRKAKPETHHVNIPKKILEQIGYFEQKSELFPELITAKDRNETRKLPQETKNQRHQMVEEQSH